MIRVGRFILRHRLLAAHHLAHNPKGDRRECWMCRAVWAALLVDPEFQRLTREISR